MQYNGKYKKSIVLLNKDIKFYGRRLDIIGKGTYGKVYQYATDNDTVAIKSVVVDITEQLPFSPDILIELSILLRLQHKNIINIIDIVKSKEDNMLTLGIVQPLANYDLYTVIYKMDYNIKIKDYITYQILYGLSYLHSEDILHGDIKPQNILIFDNNLVKICDFGISISHITSNTENLKSPIYSLWYRPPEILVSNDYIYKLSADIWAIGVTLWEFYTKKVLFPGDIEQDQWNKIEYILGSPCSSLKWLNFKPIVRINGNISSKIINIFQRLPTDSIRDIISSTILYNPIYRASANSLLKHSLFDLFREKEYILTHIYENRERHPIKNININTKDAIEYLYKIALYERLEAKTILIACQIYEEVIQKLLNMELNNNRNLIIAIITIAVDLNETIGDKNTDYKMYFNTLTISEYRITICDLLQYDFNFTTTIDYLNEYYTDDYKNSILISLLLTIPHLNIKYELLQHDIFKLCTLTCDYIFNNDKVVKNIFIDQLLNNSNNAYFINIFLNYSEGFSFMKTINRLNRI